MTRSRNLLTALGVTTLLVYLTTSTGLVDGSSKLILALAFGIGPMAIVGVLGLVERLVPHASERMTRLSRIFLVSAFVLFTLMVIVQQMTLMQFETLRAAADPVMTESLNVIFNGVNTVQLGIDVAFDLFYCIGIIVLAAAMYRHPEFNRFTSIFGVVSAGALLALNLYAFPNIPKESGLVDLGPVTGIWWLMVIAQVIRTRWRTRVDPVPA
ncbi:MAG TPA: hypothetical protein VF128_04040 [Gemmatimonadaceae bacterium]